MNALTPSPPDTSSVSGVDVIQAVRESAMLADVTISVWGAERTDRRATDELKASNNATGEVGRFVKNLLAGCDDKLKATRSAYAAVRTLHYQLTLPWVSDPHAQRQSGPRLLPHLLFERYMKEMSAQKRAATLALDQFIAEYPDLVNRARTNLGGLADATYPSCDEVRSYFRIGFDFEPIPAGASFKGLPSHTLERLAKGLQAKQTRMIEAAQAAMWEAVRDRVSHLASRLADPEAKFKSSTVEHVRDLITLLPGWAVTGDARAAEIVRDIDDMLTGVRVEELRDDQRVRTTVVTQAQAVADKLSKWGL